MKNIKSTIIISSLLFAFVIPAQSQVSLNSIRRQAHKSMGRAIDRKIEKEIDKAAQSVVNKYWDRVLGKYYQDMYQTGEDENGEPIYPFVMTSNAKIKDAYSFDNKLKMKMDTYKSNGKLDETVYISTYTNTSGNYLGTKVESKNTKNSDDEFFIINDFDNESMVMLTEEDGEKNRISFAFTLDEGVVEEYNQQQVTDQELAKYKEIGTKEILGYTCKGYLKEDNENISEVWVSEKPIAGTEKAAAMLSKNKGANVPSGYPKGSMMETTVTDKETKEKFVMKVVNIDSSIELNFRMDEYTNSLK